MVNLLVMSWLNIKGLIVQGINDFVILIYYSKFGYLIISLTCLLLATICNEMCTSSEIYTKNSIRCGTLLVDICEYH